MASSPTRFQSQSSRNLFTSNYNRVPHRRLPANPVKSKPRPLKPKKALPLLSNSNQPNHMTKSHSLPHRNVKLPNKPPFNRPISPNKYKPSINIINTNMVSSYQIKPKNNSKPINNNNNNNNYPSKPIPIPFGNKNSKNQNKHFSHSNHASHNNNNNMINPTNKPLPSPSSKLLKPFFGTKHLPASPTRHIKSKSFHIKKLPSLYKKHKKHKKNIKKLNNNNNIYDDSHFISSDLDNNSISKYCWIRGDLIGIGAFGKVYRGYDKNSGKVLAIKQIAFDPFSATDPSNLNIIDREATIMKQLKHPNIVSFYDYQRSLKYKTLCILMEYISGESIDMIYSKNGRFSEYKIQKYTYGILLGLQFAHKRCVIHRDIKGKNILISNKDNVKLADFGSAKLADSNTLSSTGNNKFQASMNYNYTPLWTAPEVLHGDYNDKIDIWSLGCVIIEMVNAKKPWSECGFENPFAALYHIGNDNNYPKWPKTLSKTLQDFIRLCLIRDPSKRCSASELLTHKFLDNTV